MSRMKSRCKVLCTSRVYVVRSRYFYCICGGPCKAMRGAIPVSGRLNPTVSHVSHKTWGNNISFHWRKPVFCTHFIVKEDGGEKGQIVLFFPARYMTQKKPSFRCGTERENNKEEWSLVLLKDFRKPFEQASKILSYPRHNPLITFQSRKENIWKANKYY